MTRSSWVICCKSRRSSRPRGARRRWRCGAACPTSCARSNPRRCGGWSRWAATSSSGVSSCWTPRRGWPWTQCSRSSRPPPTRRSKRYPIRSSACSRSSPRTRTGGARRSGRKPTSRCASRFRSCSGGGRSPTRTPVYGTALERMARANPLFIAPAEGGYPAEPDRVVAMALEVDVVGPRTLPAVDRVVHEGRLPQLLDALAELPATSAAAAQVWERTATAEVIGRVGATEPVDFKVLDRLVPRVGSSAAAPLLDALAAAESRGTRRGLLAQLARMGCGIGPIVVARLEDPRWYVTRNMLGLLDELPALPEGFSPARYTLHADARVRWQAVKLQLKLPAERDAALVTALRDHEPRIMRLALGLLVALQACPEVLVPLLVSHATDRTLASDLRVLAIRALGGTSAPAALEALLRLTSAGRTLFGRARFPPKSPEVVVALQALATGWRGDPRAAARLTQAAASSDPEICAAARTARALR